MRIQGVPSSFIAAALCMAITPVAVVAQSGTVNGSGSTFVAALMSKWSTEYHALFPNIQMNYRSLGSGGGRKEFLARTVAFGASDAPLTDDQLTQAGGPGSVVYIPVTQGSVVIAYNLSGVSKSGLSGPIRFSPETIAGIFLGEIKLWNDPKIAADNPGVSLPAIPVLVVHRSDAWGTNDVLTDYLTKVSAKWKSRVGRGLDVKWPAGTGDLGFGVANQIRNREGSVGFMELAYARQFKLAYSSVKNQAGNYIDPDPKNVTNAAESLREVPDNLLFSMTNQPGSQAYPISFFHMDSALHEAIGPRAGQTRYCLCTVGHH